METVILKRTLRNGQETMEAMPRIVAELTLALVPTDEPMTARAIIRPYEPPAVNAKSIYRNTPIKPSTYAAMALGRILWSSNPAGLQA